MELTPEFRKVRHELVVAMISNDYMIKAIKELHKDYKDDRLIELLKLAHTASTNTHLVNHWFYEHHREETLAYNEELQTEEE